jgi:hypothetical protein
MKWYSNCGPQVLQLEPRVDPAEVLISKNVYGEIQRVRVKSPSGYPPACIVRSGVKDPTDINYIVIPLVK